ncbi:MAG: PEGA domain-containing protein [Candidatus Krumholzibacteriota bacterium]|nr:PEGA domain-containing protein [Candidatus Krumholzibacteriota bacterium]
MILLLCPAPVRSQDENPVPSADNPFEGIELLRSQGRYEEAIEMLREVVRDADQPPETLQRAYCEIVFTYMLTGNWQSAEAEARAALKIFPDIQPDTRFVPPLIGEIFTRQREAIFGSIKITTIPDLAQVFMNGKLVGYSPLTLDYVESGEVNLRLVRQGYREMSIDVSVTAGNVTTVKFPLQSLIEREPENPAIWGGGLGVGAVTLMAKHYKFGDFGFTPFTFLWFAHRRIPFLTYHLFCQAAFPGSKESSLSYNIHTVRLIKVSLGFEFSDPDLWFDSADPYLSMGLGLYAVWYEGASYKAYKPGLTVALGTRVFSAPRNAVDFSIRYDYVPEGEMFDDLRFSPDPYERVIRDMHTLTLGVSVYFGRNKE